MIKSRDYFNQILDVENKLKNIYDELNEVKKTIEDLKDQSSDLQYENANLGANMQMWREIINKKDTVIYNQTVEIAALKCELGKWEAGLYKPVQKDGDGLE